MMRSSKLTLAAALVLSTPKPRPGNPGSGAKRCRDVNPL